MFGVRSGDRVSRVFVSATRLRKRGDQVRVGLEFLMFSFLGDDEKDDLLFVRVCLGCSKMVFVLWLWRVVCVVCEKCL